MTGQLRIAIPSAGKKIENYVSAVKHLGEYADTVSYDVEVSEFDGLIMPGGYDVYPKWYGEEIAGSLKMDRELDSLQFMVREINQSTVAPEDRLSDFVYHYDSKDHVLEKAETFALRMAQKEQEAEKAAAEAEQKGPEQMEPGQKDPERKDPSPERKDAGKDDRKPERDSDSRRDKGKEKTSVLARLNDKKEKLKAQPKKDVPGRKQEAALG